MTHDEIQEQHRVALESMSTLQRLAMAREILAALISSEAKHAKKPEYVARKEALDGVFSAEERARAAGAFPQVDWFLPLDNDLPLQTL